MADNYRRTKSGMKYVFYDVPVRLDKVDVALNYQSGGAIVYREPEEDDDVIEIYAHAEYVEDWKEGKYIDELEKLQKIKKLGDYCVDFLEPICERHIDMKNFQIMSKARFYSEMNSRFKYLIFTCKRVFGDEADNMTFYIKSDRENDGIVIYGYSIKPLTEEELADYEGAEPLPLSVYQSRVEKIEAHRQRFSEIMAEDDVDDEELEEYFSVNMKELYDDSEDYRREEQKRERHSGKREISDSVFWVEKEPEIVGKIRKWLDVTSFNKFCDNITSRVMGQEETELVALNIYNYLECMVHRVKHNNNMLLAAPSGCGKTETYRAVRDYFAEKIPDLVIYQVDMTTLTEEGYKGMDTNGVVEPIKPADGGVGIAFLDEFDKKLVPSYSSNGTNVNLAVQAQLLTLIEGRMVYGSRNGTPKNTQNTLFIAMGAFDSCRQKKAVVEKHMGFGRENEGGAEHYTSINREDMIDLGGSYELIGRFSTIINYHELSDESVDRIINLILNKVVYAIRCRVGLSAEMRALLHRSANSQYGCRILESIIRESAMRGYLELKKADVELERYTIILKDRDKCEFRGIEPKDITAVRGRAS